MSLAVVYAIICGFMVLCGLMYLIMITAFDAGLLKLNRNAPPSASLPHKTFISIVIPARNEERHIGACLEDLAGQDYPEALFEIIVVDDDSADGTSSIVKTFAENNNGLCVTLISPDGSIEGARKKRALESAVNIAKGELILTTDADCRMGKQHLSIFADAYESSHPQMILGPVAFIGAKTIFAELQSLEFLSLIASGAAMAGLGRPMFANGANMAFTRNAFFESGAYSGNKHIASGDDVFLLHSVRKHFGSEHVQFLWKPDALVYTYPQPTLKLFMNQRARWASKAKGYKDPWLVFVSLAVFLFCLALLTGIASAFFHWSFAVLAIILWLMKCVADFPLLVKITSFTGQRDLMRHYAWFQLIYPFYVIPAAVMGLLGKFSWKGRGV